MVNGWESMDDIKKIISRLSLEEKIAQMIMIDFSGPELPVEFENYFRRYKPGGVILFKKNLIEYQQTKDLISSLQNLTQSLNLPPLLVSVDQEGGNIAPIVFSETISPGNMAMSACGNPDYIYQSAKYSALEMRELGFNLVFAPVVDVNVNWLNPIVNVRAYGDEPEKISQLAALAVNGFQEYGVAACGKHFPGHGNTSLDSHLELPTITDSLRDIENIDLLPYKKIISAGVDTIMIAHILFPDLDKEYPSSLSEKITTNLLRNKLNFNGVVITDSLQMKAVADNYKMSDIVVKSVHSGADILLACGCRDVQEEILYSFKKAVKDNIISQVRINESLHRILKLKYKLSSIKPDKTVDFKEESAQLNKKVASESITLFKNQKGLLPLKLSPDELLGVIYPDSSDIKFDLEKEILKLHNKTVIHKFSPDESQFDLNEISEKFSKCKVIFIATFSRGPIPDAQKKLIEKLYSLNDNLIIAAIYNPYHLLSLPKVSTYITTYSYQPESLRALVKVIFGEMPPRGKSPVNLGEYKRGYGLSYK